MKRILLILFLICFVVSIVLISGCASTRPAFSADAGSITQQRVIGMATDRALRQADFKPLAGRKIYIEMVGFSTLREAEFIKQSVRENIQGVGGIIVEVAPESDIKVQINIKVAGVDYGTGRVPLISRTDKVPSTVRLVISYIDMKSKDVMYSKTVEGQATYKETRYWFGIESRKYE
ncbi:MAG: hypothetical protein QME64_09275 [bacterium]|nr:hypothetical protein [bacterium]